MAGLPPNDIHSVRPFQSEFFGSLVSLSKKLWFSPELRWHEDSRGVYQCFDDVVSLLIRNVGSYWEAKNLICGA